MNKIELAKSIMQIDHIGIQCDDIHCCEYKHQLILELDKLDKFDAIRLLMHVIHVQNLLIVDIDTKINNDNPFKEMVDFKFLDSYLKCNTPTQTTLY